MSTLINIVAAGWVLVLIGILCSRNTHLLGKIICLTVTAIYIGTTMKCMPLLIAGVLGTTVFGGYAIITGMKVK